VHFPVTTLGPGFRAGIWFQGCSIRCPGCVSRDTWDEATPDRQVTVGSIVDWVVSRAPGLAGITVSGGEPFDQPAGLHELLRAIRATPALDDVDVLVYSGYGSSYLARRHREILSLLDAVLTGPFVASRPTTLPWRGSANQKLSLLTARASHRFAEAPAGRPALQVSTDGRQLWITGIPRQADLDRLEHLLLGRGVELEGASWRA
jgi:anaerobic ribonucleoside-triphosphate reductase activating protein